MEIVASALLWGGLVVAFVGAVNVARPLRFLRISTRRRGTLVAVAGLLMFMMAVSLPPRVTSATALGSRLDEFVPDWQFEERHDIRVHAPGPRVFQAIKDVTAEEIRLFRTLTWLRHPRRPGKETPESLLSPPEGKAILAVALRSGFVLLADDTDRELVMGAIVCCSPEDTRRLLPGLYARPQSFIDLDELGVAKAGMNFRLEDEGGGWTRVTTETRVWATDEVASRRFAVYWRVIYPGSALIRRMWLRAIKARAESGEVRT